MLGPEKVRYLDRPILFSLDAAVPKDDFYRHLHRALDLSLVRDLTADCYAGAGRPSIGPVVFFKLRLVMFFEGIRSERQFMRVVADRLSLRWYVGYNLDEPLPTIPASPASAIASAPTASTASSSISWRSAGMPDWCVGANSSSTRSRCAPTRTSTRSSPLVSGGETACRCPVRGV